MEYTDDYKPKITIADVEYDSYLLQLHREIVSNKIAEDRDSPNPFRATIIEDNVKTVINDTNDLHYALKHFEKKIELGIYDYEIGFKIFLCVCGCSISQKSKIRVFCSETRKYPKNTVFYSFFR